MPTGIGFNPPAPQPPKRTYHLVRRTARDRRRQLQLQFPAWEWQIVSLGPISRWGWKVVRGARKAPTLADELREARESREPM